MVLKCFCQKLAGEIIYALVNYELTIVFRQFAIGSCQSAQRKSPVRLSNEVSTDVRFKLVSKNCSAPSDNN